LTAILSIYNDINSIDNFIADINSSNAYYFWVGKTTPWPNDSSPPPANNSYNEFEQSIYHDIVFGKQITNNNIAQLISNYPWTNNVVYAQYDENDANLFEEMFYVVNDVNSVYKVIDNGGGANSIVQPTITPTTGTFQTSDGYTWKYMFTIPTVANNLFTTNQYIPVVPNTAVSNNAVPGTIDVIRVTIPGLNWQTYNTGTLVNVLSPTTVQLAVNAISIDNFYTGASIYLKAGLGAAQLRQITAYNGETQVATVNTAFNTLVNLFLGTNLTGSWLIGDVVQQNYTVIAFLFQSGFFNAGDTVVQSDTGATGTIYTVNSSIMSINQTVGNNFSIAGNTFYPIRDTVAGDVIQTGGATITAGSNVITGNSTANFTTLTVNNFVRVGSSSNNNIRRITAITNSSQMSVSLPFNNSLAGNVFYNVPYAMEPTSSTLVSSNGVITQTNLNSIIISFNNVSSNSISFINGETIKEYNSLGVDQLSNAVVSFANSSALVLSNINGTFEDGLFIVGQSSTLKAQLTNIITYPNVTLRNAVGTFLAGDLAASYFANGTIAGSATVMAASYTPSQATEYIISPTVNITGDGEGALAYSVVNTNPSTNFPISGIVMINNGEGYTEADVSLSGNNLWGNGTSLVPVISPVNGHGFDAYSELGADNLGINMTFDTATNESYYFPNYGSYRRVGIIKNPLFNDLRLNVANTQRQNFVITMIGANTFVNNEIILQGNNAARVVASNSTFMQVKDINGTINANAHILGLTSISTANVVTISNCEFILSNPDQTIFETNTGATGILTEVVSDNQIRMTNVSGKFKANTVCFDPSSNAYANVISLLTSNGTVNSSITFGLRFNQTSRLTLSTNSGTFQVGEYINQDVSNALGLIVDNTHEIDIIYNNLSGTFSTGVAITDANSGANGVITFANSSYLRVTGANGTFSTGDQITTVTANANIVDSLQVLVVTDEPFNQPFQTGNNVVTGNTSGATGLLGISNTIVYPDLVRNSGTVLYVNDLAPFTLSLNSKETFNVIINE
jgi:hypothetical protein